MTASPSVLVTGATGFLGSHLVRRLVADGARVHVLTRPNSSWERLTDVAPRLVRWTGDVADTGAVERCCRDAAPEVIFHLAGDTGGRRFEDDWSVVDRAHDANVRGTLNVLRAAAASAPIRAMVRVGGLEEYGDGPTPYAESQREQPISPYSASQVAATHWCQMLQAHLPFAVVTLRPALIYGPAQATDFLIPGLIVSLLRGERFRMRNGQQHRDLLYVDDFVDAAIRAADRPGLRGAVVNVSSGREQMIRDVATWIARHLDAEALLDIGAVPERPGDLAHLVGRNDEARRLLGWQPEVSLEDGLRRTVAWYRAMASAVELS